MKLKKILLGALTFSVLLNSCETDANEVDVTPDSEKVDDTTPKVPTPDFNSDSAFAFIQQQVDFGPRVPNSPEHDSCGNWLVDQLEFYGFSVIEQEGQAKAWDGNLLQMKNIIGQFDPENPERIMLCAHWDTRPYADKDTINKFKPIDGANDGASGVGVLLEVARQVQQNSPGYGVDIIFFDAEDYGTFNDAKFQDLASMAKDWCLGSQYWAKNPPIENYNPSYGILLDMVGAPNATFPKEGVSQMNAANKVYAIWEAAGNMGYGQFFEKKLAGPITDDHVYVNDIAGIPCIDIIDMNVQGQYWTFGAFHHTHADNMDIIDKKTLKAVGQVVLEAIYQKL